jgi:hypothetical protein
MNRLLEYEYPILEGFSSVGIGIGYPLALLLIQRRHNATNKLVIQSNIF